MKFIFLTYVNRSGSTFLANQLSKSENICVCPEANILVELFLVRPNKQVSANIQTIVKTQFFRNKEYKNWALEEDFCKGIKPESTNFECFNLILETYKNKNKPNATTLLFKSERLIELYGNFHNPKFYKHEIYWLAIIRDCRAVYNSQHKTLWPGTNKKMSSSPVRTAQFWQSFVRQSIKLSKNRDFHIVKYEDLVEHTVETLSDIIQFIKADNISKNENLGDLYSRLSMNEKSIHKNINSPALNSRINAWQTELTKKEVCIIESITQKFLIELDYVLKSKQIRISIAINTRMLMFFDIFRKQFKRLKYKLRILYKGY